MIALTRILVATDLSSSGDAALGRAGQLAKQFGAQLQVVHVTPDWNLFSRFADADQRHYAQVQERAQAALRGDVERLAMEFGITARAETHSGSASQGIMRSVATYQPQLVVIGARGEHAPPIAPAALGGTALKLIAQAAQPLLLVRNNDPRPYRISLAAVHETRELSTRVAEWGASLVGSGQCHVIRAFDVPYVERLRACGITQDAVATCMSDAQSKAHAITEEIIDTVQGKAQLHMRVVQGEALATVLTAIVPVGAQVLVVGKHDVRTDRNTQSFFGSVGVRMAYHSPVDALIVP